jgi:transposase
MYRKDTWVNAKAMRSQGMSYNEIANALGINKRTAIKLCKRDEIPTPAPRERPSILDPFTEIIDDWLEKRPRMNATVIFSQLGPLGYEGSYPTVKRYVASKKEELAHRATVRFETLPGFQAQVDFGFSSQPTCSMVDMLMMSPYFLSGWKSTTSSLITPFAFSYLSRTSCSTWIW